jgi:bacterioferritin
MLTERFLQPGGTPLLTPKDWVEMTNCGYGIPEDPYWEALLEQTIKGERCAIDVYQKLAELTKDVDPITHHIVLELLEDEVEHEDDLAAFVADIELMKARRA